MRLAVCILHYGSANLTARLHAQLAAADAGHDALFVLDNASPEAYSSAWKRLPENIYWGGALAWALEAFTRADFTHLWFLNNDAVFVSPAPYISRALTRFRWLEKNGKIGIYSPSLTANPYHPHMVTKRESEYSSAAYVDGIAPLISLDCVRELGGLDLGDNPFGYGVDLWLSLRAFRSGWRVLVDHALVLRHTYHSAARQTDGFFAVVADAQERYLTERLGIDWRVQLSKIQTQEGYS